MVSGDNVTVTLTGGSPWGFRLTGGGSMPLQIAKVRVLRKVNEIKLNEEENTMKTNSDCFAS